MEGAAMNGISSPTGWLRFSKLFFSLVLAVGLLSLLAGCASTGSQDAAKASALPHSTTVGALSIGYPDNLAIHNENVSTSIPGGLPEGMTAGTGTTLMNDDYSIVISVVQVDDPGHLGIAALEEYWNAIAANALVDAETQAQTYEKFPGLQGMAENTVIEGSERVEANGNRVLKVVQTVRDSVRMATYYVESDGQIIGAVAGTSPVALYQSDPEYLESIFASIQVA